MTPTLDTEFEALLVAARGGSRSALGRLLERARPRLERHAATAAATRPRLRGREADVVAETILDAVAGFGRFLGATEMGWGKWLLCALDHNIVDLGRYDGAAKRDSWKEVRLDTSLYLALTDGGETPSKTVARDEEVERLRRALARLPADQQAVIRLHVAERLTFPEIARRLNTTEEAARKQFNRAKERLKEVFDALEHP